MALLLAERDPVFFMNEFCWTYDPREPTPFIPFDLFPDQEKAVEFLKDLMERGKDGILEKSRDMGATWLTAAFAVWVWLFKPGAAIGFGSRKLELVDKIGDPKCIFEKIRTIINNLPAWLLQIKAAGYDPKQHDNFCKIVNPGNRATITGEGGDEIGRGGRTTLYFVDEAAFLPRPLMVDQALSANSRCKVYVSTPRGANNPFAVKRLSGRFPTFTLHWKSDPRKTPWCIVPTGWEGKIDQDGELVINDEDIRDYGLGKPPEEIPDGWKLIYPWYEEKVLKEDPLTVAQEYDIDYTASLEGVIIPARWLRVCVGLKLKESAIGSSGFDVAAGGSAENVYINRKGPVLKRIVRWREEDPTRATFKVIGLTEEDRATKLFFDSIGVGAGVGGAIKLVQRKLGFSWAGVNVGKSPTDTIWADKATSKEKFANLKAELWWRLRARVERTYQYVTQGIMHPEEDLLSLPEGADTEALIAQLSGVRYFETETGKIIVESKMQLRDRGVASPDIAEALVLSFSPVSLVAKGTKSGSSGNVPKVPGVTSSTMKPTPSHQIIKPTGRRRGNSA